MTSAAGHILVVEDNPTSRNLFEIALARLGYTVTVAENASEAQEYLSPARIGSVACVLTDYLMPGMNGLELLAWIRERDAALATIVVTAQGERSLVAESLRSGAIDFLDKPLELKRLESAVARAVAQTARHRHMAQSESSAKDLGLIQQRILHADIGRCSGILQVHSFPKHEAGGDYFTHFRPAPTQLLCLLTDVSGHNLQAAYVSAYFQGFVRGMLKRGASMDGILADFNSFLLEELNGSGAVDSNTSGIEASVAVCALLLDFEAKTATITTHGTPAPVHLAASGRVKIAGEHGGFPLGWFPALTSQQTVHSIAEGGTIYLWTDGFEDLARREGVSTLSLAFALQQSRDHHEQLTGLADASDDVLLAVIHLSAEETNFGPSWTIISEEYQGDESGKIDSLQSYWRRSLNLAAPGFPVFRFHDILLASREIVLNALEHGCDGFAERTARYHVEYYPQKQVFRVRISDPGKGHQFNITDYEQRAETELLEEHRGLILIKHLANKIRFENKGATVTMEFAPEPPLTISSNL